MKAPYDMPFAQGADVLRIIEQEKDQAINEERRRFAGELHDLLASGLHAASLMMAEAQQALPDDPQLAMEALIAAQQQIADCWQDARRSAVALRPLSLDNLGLLPTLSHFAKMINGIGHMEVRFDTHGTPRNLPGDVDMTIARVTQEATTNAMRHSAAGAISIELSFDANEVRLEVADNGRGFEPYRTPPGTGLIAMRDRARRSGGELQVFSRLGSGTEVILTIPSPSEIMLSSNASEFALFACPLDTIPLDGPASDAFVG